MSETDNFQTAQGERLAELVRTFVDAGDQNAAALPYFYNGGCLRQCLSEIIELAGPTELERYTDTTRENFMAAVLTRPTWRNRLERKKAVAATEGDYVDSVIDKIGAVIDASNTLAALAVRQMPSLVEKASFKAGRAIPIRDLAANHLYLLMDTALQEHNERRKLIFNHQNASWRARISGNRVLRLSIASGLFAAAFVPELGVVPTPEEYIADDIELALKVTSGVIFGLDAPEVARLKYLQIKNDKRTKALQTQLAQDPDLTDLALRIVYSSPRYGSSKGPLQISSRFGTEDSEENLRRFSIMEDEFARLHGDPGGKPYSAAQALGYAARFLIERPAQLDELCLPLLDVKAHRQNYLEFCREIIAEDIARMKAGLTVTRYRKEVMKAVGVIPTVLFPSLMGGAGDAAALSRDTTHMIEGSKSHKQE